LNYLFRTAAEEGDYTVFGYQGKQVRDQIHSVDVVRAMLAFFENPRAGEVYNIGGGRENSASVLECISAVESLTGNKLNWTYSDTARTGDHICYITNMAKFHDHYPQWGIQRSFEEICEEIAHAIQPAKPAN
jgi:CDP-paratose 2-epimerase